jgi:hypothetical protein
MSKIKVKKPVSLGPPLQATDDELAALELPPEQAIIDAAIADWLALAPARAKGYVFAKIENVVDDVQ